MLDIKSILTQSKTIAIIGLSPDTTKDSHQVGKYLLQVGYSIVPIYPKEDEILDQKVYANLQEALWAKKPDIVVVFRRSEHCQAIAQEILQAKFLPQVFWMQLGITNQQAKDMLESQHIKVVQDKCIKIEHQRLIGG
ncbi:hypothetical protein BKH46_07790 [Helicobacter sp. 12S02634-8]|uniref:CoA-binding protein n=1 Tax=Helicobacter sp. 12S02634-8 TaxID=1476199 RepID=UPI000BA52704|nr:CoA-binding protein [Helicobacter sp. 12S02634-8]PAF46362.1 hypothetical protein BKH46_07790 [Helicobacter sp. 12S02634-8]